MILIETLTNNVIISANDITLNSDHAVSGKKRYFGGISDSTHSLISDKSIPYGQASWWSYVAGEFVLTQAGIEAKAEEKREQIQKAAEAERNAGFTSDALGTVHEYGSTLEDRINLIGASQAGQPTKYNAKENGQRVRKQHTPAQMNQVLADGFIAMQAIKDKEDLLLNQIDATTTVEELDAIVW